MELNYNVKDRPPFEKVLFVVNLLVNIKKPNKENKQNDILIIYLLRRAQKN